MRDKSLHSDARDGFSVGAGSYDRGRPGYPSVLLESLATTLGISADSNVVDLGAGTGKLTKLLLPYTGVVAIEPVEAMRSILRQSCPEAHVLEGTAEFMPIADGSADVVVVAQAFHWFSTTAALHEIHRVLAPNGKLALVWNLRDETVDWVAQLMDTIRPYEGDTPRYTSGRWRSIFKDQRLFQMETHQTWQHSEQKTIDDVLAHVSSISYISSIEPSRQSLILATIQQQLKSAHPSGSLAFPYRSDLWCFSRCDIVDDQNI